MCCVSFFIFDFLISYGWIIICPAFGALFGINNVMRILIFLIVFSVISSVTHTLLGLPETCVRVGLLIAYLLLPITIIPGAVVWLCTKALWLAEPICQVFEAVGAVRLIMCLTEALRDREEESQWDDEHLYIKAVLPGVMCVTSGASLWLLHATLSNLDASYFLTMVCLTVLCVLLLLHFAAYSFETFEFSDVSLRSMCCMVLLYGVSRQYTNAAEPRIELPQHWQRMASEGSYLSLCIRIISGGLGDLENGLRFVSFMIEPWFLLSAALRVCCLLIIVDLFLWYMRDREETGWELLDESGLSEGFEFSKHWNHALVKCVIYTVYAQFLINHLWINHISSRDTTWLVTRLVTWFVPHLRLVQMWGVICFYVYSAYSKAND